MPNSPPSSRFVRAAPRSGQRLHFTFDGEPMSGFEGETILTGVLCHIGHVRQFEFANTHRAGFCVMAACQDCWVWSADGTRLRACTTPLQDGMRLLRAPPIAETA